MSELSITPPLYSALQNPVLRSYPLPFLHKGHKVKTFRLDPANDALRRGSVQRVVRRERTEVLPPVIERGLEYLEGAMSARRSYKRRFPSKKQARAGFKRQRAAARPMYRRGGASYAQAQRLGNAQGVAGAVVQSGLTTHKLHTPRRGALLAMGSYKDKPSVKPERVSIVLPQAKLGVRYTRVEDASNASGKQCQPYELCPGLFCNEAATDGRAPIKGVGSGSRIKNAVNCHGISFRWQTDEWSTAGNQQYRIVLLQILSPGSKVEESANSYTVRNADSINLVTHPGGIYDHNDGGATKGNAISGTMDDSGTSTEVLTWPSVFDNYGIDSYYRTAKSEMKDNIPAANVKPTYRILFDKIYPNNTEQHSGEWHIGAHEMKWTGGQDDDRAVPMMKGRLVLFLVTSPKGAGEGGFELNPGAVRVSGRYTYSDE